MPRGFSLTLVHPCKKTVAKRVSQNNPYRNRTSRYFWHQLGVERWGGSVVEMCAFAHRPLHGPCYDFERNLSLAMATVDSLGASTDAVQEDSAIVVRNYSCPVASAVRETPCICKAMAFFSEATGQPTTEHCLRKGRLICRYRIELQEKTNFSEAQK